MAEEITQVHTLNHFAEFCNLGYNTVAVALYALVLVLYLVIQNP
jgi:hypothetical protein